MAASHAVAMHEGTYKAGWAILGGLVGAVVMAMWAMIAAALQGMSVWAPVQLIATLALGASAAMHASAGVIMTGLVLHMMTGAVLGLALAGVLFVLRVRPGGARLIWGMAFGLVVWVVNQFVVLRAVDPLIASHMTWWAFGLGHLMFGVVAAAFLLTKERVVCA